MKITKNNYFDKVKEIGFENLPLVLKQVHTLIMVKTNNGKDWTEYNTNADLKKMVDTAFTKLEEFIQSGNTELSGTSKKKNPYSLISKEVQFIQRFLDFDGKILYKKTFEIFIDELQKAIEEKKITKKSPVAKDIMAIQQAALAAFNSMSNAKHFVLKPTTVKHLKGIIEKYENAYDDIDQSYVKTKKKKMDLSGINQTPQVNIMPSTDFTNLHFNTIGFKEKWLAFIGDPAPGFTAMVFGMPKMGKSYLCVDFAGYLARNHGKVLYVAKEEKLDKTLQDKLNDKQVAHENLFVADALPADLTGYDFIILDSVNKLGLSPKDLNTLKAENPGKSFIYIFQATKGGQFKGNNEFQHDVDVVIEVPEQGKAIQYGRFNQGGEMNIFEDAPADETEELNGVKQHIIEIEAEFPVPLGELFIYIKKKGEKVEDIVDILDNEPERGISEMKKIANLIIRKKNLKIKILDLEHSYNDSSNVTHGVAYFSIKLSGEKKDLKKIAGEDKEIFYDWESGLDGSKKNAGKTAASKKTIKKKDWTEPEWLNQADWRNLKIIKKHCDKGEYKEAMAHAMDCDTVIREEIPGDIWKKMGGQLTKTGEEKLKVASSYYGDTPDANNPKLIFSTTSTALLVSILDGGINIDYCVREELANRGLDTHGDWVGFNEAAKISKIKK